MPLSLSFLFLLPCDCFFVFLNTIVVDDVVVDVVVVAVVVVVIVPYLLFVQNIIFVVACCLL